MTREEFLAPIVAALPELEDAIGLALDALLSTQGEAQREAGNQSSRERSPSTRAAPPPVLADHGGSESATTRAEAADYRARLYAAERERDELRQALGECIEFAIEGWSYASPYFREKWDYEGQLARARALLTPKEPG